MMDFEVSGIDMLSSQTVKLVVCAQKFGDAIYAAAKIDWRFGNGGTLVQRSVTMLGSTR